MPSSWTSVVRMGPAEAPATTQLRAALLRYLRSDADHDNPTIQVTNRYFRATVRVEEIGGSAWEEGWKEDGIILVFADDPVPEDDSVATGTSVSSSRHDPLEHLSALHHTAVERPPERRAGELLRLCVSLSAAPWPESYRNSKLYEQEYARRIHWCLDRGYEYVECDLSSMDQGHEERDKEGFARIVEAFAGTVWSSAVMEKRTKTHLQQAYEQEKACLETKDEEPEDEEPVNEYEPPDPSKLPPLGDMAVGPTEEEDREREERARQQLMEGCRTEDNSTTYDPVAQTERQRELEDDRLLDTMESVLKRAATIRETSQSGSMTDEDRRKRAGDAAMLLYQLMDQMGFDESDGEEDSGDEKGST